MANITYTRNFQHTNWQDNVDRVQAGGPAGFNQHFHDIEGDFDALSQVVGQINAALDALGQKPPPAAVKLTLTPNLMQTAVNGWSHLQGLAQKPPTQTSAAGMMSVSFPGPVQIQSLRAIGSNSGAGSLQISLFRMPIAGTGNRERIAGLSGSSDPFDLTVPGDAAFATVDPAQFKLFILAEVNNAQQADTVILTAFQITYQPQ